MPKQGGEDALAITDPQDPLHTVGNNAFRFREVRSLVIY